MKEKEGDSREKNAGGGRNGGANSVIVHIIQMGFIQKTHYKKNEIVKNKT